MGAPFFAPVVRISFKNLLSAPHALEIMALFDNAGYPIRIVGGAVRDALLGRMIHDIDMAVAASPDQIITVLKPVCAVIPTGLRHGTVTAVFKDHTTFQITSLRFDEKTFGRHADVRFHHSFEEDAKRRDFTINALFLDRHGNLYDYVGGEKDVYNQKVRFIGDPTTRIKEDYLRILRFFRMHAFFGREIDEESLLACTTEAPFLKTLSRERIRSEFFRLLEAPTFFNVLKIMNDHHLLSSLFQDTPLHLEPLEHYEHLHTQRHAFKEVGKYPFLTQQKGASTLIKLYLLASHFALEDITSLYRLTRPEKKLYALLHKEYTPKDFLDKKVSTAPCPKELNEDLSRWAFYYGQNEAYTLFCISLSLYPHFSLKEKKDMIELCLSILRALQPAPLPITIKDLREAGIPPHQLSQTLKSLEETWCKRGFIGTKNDLLAVL